MTGKPSVLILDDEPDVANILQMFLEDAFDVATFSDPRLASTEIESKSYDLIVSDIKMPHMSGYEMVKFVKRVSPVTPIVLMTGHAQSGQDIEFAQGLGASNVLCKPFGDMTKVVSLLQSIVRPARVSLGQAKPRVMVIEDEPDLVDVLNIYLQDDYDLRLFTDPIEALKQVNETFQLILTDVKMPKMSGAEVIRKMRAKNITVPIVIMSGYAPDQKEVMDAMRAGGTVHMAKPFPAIEIVLEKLGKLLTP